MKDRGAEAKGVLKIFNRSRIYERLKRIEFV